MTSGIGWGAVGTTLLVGVCAFAGCEKRSAKAPEPEPSKIVVLNNDCTQFQATFPEEKMTEAGAKEYFDRMNVGGNTHFFMNPQGLVAYYPSKVLDTAWHADDPRVKVNDSPCTKRAKLLADRGVDQYAVWVKCARARGISPWLSMRMNDIHSICSPDSSHESRFWLDHPEFRRVPGSNGGRNWSHGALDFTHREVRDLALATAREMLENWDVDGFECDWLRFPHQVNDAAEKDGSGCAALTAFMRDLRRVVDEIGARRGRKIKIAVRVASRMEAAKGLGTDAVAWVKEGLVDWVIASNFFTCTDFGLPLAQWREALKAANPQVKVLVGLDHAGVCRANIFRSPTLEECNGYFERMYAEKTDGFYFFNYFCYNGTPAATLIQKQGCADEATVRAAARAYPVTFVDATPAGMPSGNRFPCTVQAAQSFKIKIGKVGNPAGASVQLLFEGAVGEQLAPAVTLNGQRGKGFRVLDAKTILPTLKPNHGFAACEIDLPVAALVDGVNEVTVGPSAKPLRLQGVELCLQANKKTEAK